MAVYFATKSFVLFLSEALYSELKGTGVSVTCLCPGPTESGFIAAAAMEKSNLFNNKKIPSAAEVAEFGYKAMMNNEMTVIHGLLNKISVAAVRFAPRKLVLEIAKKITGDPPLKK
jgi:short-subunit dehydrogenase